MTVGVVRAVTASCVAVSQFEFKLICLRMVNLNEIDEKTLSYKELRALCKELNVSAKGKKAELQERIKILRDVLDEEIQAEEEEEEEVVQEKEIVSKTFSTPKSPRTRTPPPPKSRSSSKSREQPVVSVQSSKFLELVHSVGQLGLFTNPENVAKLGLIKGQGNATKALEWIVKNADLAQAKSLEDIYEVTITPDPQTANIQPANTQTPASSSAVTTTIATIESSKLRVLSIKFDKKRTHMITFDANEADKDVLSKVQGSIRSLLFPAADKST